MHNQDYCCASYPILNTRLRKTIGKTVPPIDEPHATYPRAVPLLFLNQCDTAARVGPKMRPEDNYGVLVSLATLIMGMCYIPLRQSLDRVGIANIPYTVLLGT